MFDPSIVTAIRAAENRDMLGRRLERRGYEVVLRESAIDIENVTRCIVWPLLMVNTPDLFNMELGLTVFQFAFSTDYGKLMAGSVISTIPMLVIFLFMRRRILESSSSMRQNSLMQRSSLMLQSSLMRLRCHL